MSRAYIGNNEYDWKSYSSDDEEYNEYLAVACSECNEGNLYGNNVIDDHYRVSCTKCDNVFLVHYTAYDALLEEHDYLVQLNDDVKMLNENGNWLIKSGGYIFKEDKFNLEEYTKGWKLMHVINSYEEEQYYRQGCSFMKIVYNGIHKRYQVYVYVANNGEPMKKLLKHFANIDLDLM